MQPICHAVSRRALSRQALSRRALSRYAVTPLLAAAVTLTASAWAGPRAVPFRAAVVTQETLRGDPTACPAPPYLAGNTTGNGVASHMGAISFVADDCVTPSETMVTFTFSNGRLTITAANGDKLTASYGGTLTLLPNRFPLYTVDGDFQVTGGTGRFAGATGAGSMQGLTNTQSGQGFFTLLGSISY